MFIGKLKSFRRSLNSLYVRIKWNMFFGCRLARGVTLGRRVNMARGTRIGRGSYIGQYSYIGPNVEIGKYVMFADNVNVVGSDHEFLAVGTPIIYSGIPVGQPHTLVGNDVWVGHGAVIMRGCTLGDGAIIGANAVVTRDVEPCAVYAGVPAKKVKDRFTSEEDTRKHLQLLRLNWGANEK